jgi:septal ring factor EnvC (AmiA/AmiB activator)
MTPDSSFIELVVMVVAAVLGGGGLSGFLWARARSRWKNVATDLTIVQGAVNLLREEVDRVQARLKQAEDRANEYATKIRSHEARIRELERENHRLAAVELENEELRKEIADLRNGAE